MEQLFPWIQRSAMGCHNLSGCIHIFMQLHLFWDMIFVFAMISRENKGKERSVNFRTNLWSHRFSQNTNKNCQDFCPHYKGEKFWQFSFRILEEMLTSWIESSDESQLDPSWGTLIFEQCVCQKIANLFKAKLGNW